MKEFILKKCSKCNTLIEVIEDCHCENCNITCCGSPMEKVSVNNKEYAFEKHIPTYKIENETLIVSVPHVMEQDHYIEWIKIISNTETHTKYFNYKDTPEFRIPLEENMVIYSYCNKHGLWKVEVNDCEQ